MASWFIRPDSKFVFLRVRRSDGSWGKVRTAVRVDAADMKRRIEVEVAKATLEESRQGLAPEAQVRGWDWVPGFLGRHYTNKKSLQRALNCMGPVMVFLKERGIDEPQAVRHGHGHEYVAWRQNPPPGTVKNRSKNTAIGEIKMLGFVLQEAVRLDLIQGNPLVRLGIRKDPVKEKEEVTREEQAVIEAALVHEPQWMRDAWLVAMRQGCRLGQTGTLLSDVDVGAMTIRLLEQKRKRHVGPLHPDLLPLVARRKAEGARTLVDLPRLPGLQWWKFLKRIGMGHLCFHSTRVTVTTRLARAGFSEAETMQYVGHASTLVHSVYRKLKAQDVARLGKALG